MLKGVLVSLRPVRRSDAVYFLKWFNDPDITRYLELDFPMSEMYLEKYIEELVSGQTGTDVIFMIEANEGDSSRCIGSTMLDHVDRKNQNAEFAIVIGEKEYWGKGYGMESAKLLLQYGFEELNLHRITSSTFSFNKRALRLHTRLNFKEEGRQRESIFREGKFHDEVNFGILRGEYK